MHSSATPASGAAGESGAAARLAAGRQILARRPSQTSAQTASRSAQAARQVRQRALQWAGRPWLAGHRQRPLGQRHDRCCREGIQVL